MLHELELGAIEVAPLLHGNRVGVGLAGTSGDGDGRGTRFEAVNGLPPVRRVTLQDSGIADCETGDETAVLSSMAMAH